MDAFDIDTGNMTLQNGGVPVDSPEGIPFNPFFDDYIGEDYGNTSDPQAHSSV